MTRGSAVVLMYHRIGSGALPGREAREEVYAVSAEDFAAQIAVLAGCRCPVVTLAAVANAMRGRGELPPHAVALTFDDGNATDSSAVAPLLARHRYAATFFITPTRIGSEGYLDWVEVRALHDAGLSIGAHGYDHTLLPTLSDDALRRQLVDARREIGERIGSAPSLMSLPGGACDRRVLAFAAEAGYDVVASSVQRRARAGRASPTVPRFAIRHDESLPRFEALVRHQTSILWRRDLRHRWARLERSVRNAVGRGR